MGKAAFLANISGTVQGVGFRYFAYKKASEHGIDGYVKNLMDGSVEVLAEGNREDLESFLEDLKKGPSFSNVDSVQCEWNEYEGEYKSFTIEAGYDY